MPALSGGFLVRSKGANICAVGSPSSPTTSSDGATYASPQKELRTEVSHCYNRTPYQTAVAIVDKCSLQKSISSSPSFLPYIRVRVKSPSFVPSPYDLVLLTQLSLTDLSARRTQTDCEGKNFSSVSGFSFIFSEMVFELSHIDPTFGLPTLQARVLDRNTASSLLPLRKAPP